jgi:hypothetical protein
VHTSAIIQNTASTATVTTSTGNTTVLAGVNYAGFRVGAEYFDAKNYKTVTDAASAAFGTSAIVTASGAVPVSDKADGFSGWASYAFDAQWSVFGRYDEVKLSKDVAPDLKDKYLNIGVAYKPIKALGLRPGVQEREGEQRQHLDQRCRCQQLVRHRRCQRHPQWHLR